MEDKDVNPLIESTKPFSRILHDSRAKFVKFCNKYRSEIFFGTSILLVSLCLGVILSILFQGEVTVDCPEGWTKFEGRCYSLVTNYHDITVCRKHCRAQGGDLASIHSQRENDFVANFIQSRPSRGGEKDTWIAGEITQRDGAFSWMDGTPWDYDNWDVGEPDKKSFGREHHECVFMGKNLYNPGKWWDGVCAWTKWSFDCICKI